MLRIVRVGAVAALVLAVVGAGIVHADGGTIKGTVVYKGQAPAAETIPVDKDNAKCGQDKKSEKLVVGKDGGVEWAVLSLVGSKAVATEGEAPPTIDQHGCQFVPHVVVVAAGNQLTFLNNDGILHNLHTYSELNRPLNLAQPGFKKDMKLKFAQPEVVRVTCDVHPWMGGWIYVTDGALTAVTNDQGAFELTGVTPGTYKLKMWHEVLGEQTKEVTVAAGATAEVSFTLAAK